MEIPERIWHLMARVLNREASPPEQEELLVHLNENPHLQQQYELLRRVWKEGEANSGNYRDEEQIKTYISKIINKAETVADNRTAELSRRRRRRRIAVFASAILIIAVSAGWWIMNNTDHKKGSVVAYVKDQATGSSLSKEDVLIAPKGSRTRSLLPDGSTVWLNAGSKLYLENDFSGKTREVRLEGEGFFDIAKKTKQPFIVHTSGIDIRVLGTAFNVKAYPEDEMIETTLYRGLVEVSRKEDKNPPIELKPNEKLSMPKQFNELTVATVQKENLRIRTKTDFIITRIDSTKRENERFETAWRYSRLEFRGDNFSELARKLERWYNVKIEFGNESVKGLSFDGSFERESIEEALIALNEVAPFQYEINKNEILIKSPK